MTKKQTKTIKAVSLVPTKPSKKLTAKQMVAVLEGDIEALKNNIGHLTIQRDALQEQLVDNQTNIDGLLDVVQQLKLTNGMYVDSLNEIRNASLFKLIKMYFKGEI